MQCTFGIEIETSGRGGRTLTYATSQKPWNDTASKLINLVHLPKHGFPQGLLRGYVLQAAIEKTDLFELLFLPPLRV